MRLYEVDILIHQPYNPFFHIGLVETEWLDPWLREVGAGGSCDEYWYLPFFGFLKTDMLFQGYKNRLVV